MLRQQVINLRRAVKRPRLTPAERLLLVISSCFTKRWRRALHIVQAGHASSMASRPVSPSLAISLPAQQEAAATPRRRTDRADSAYGVKQPYLGLRANSRRSSSSSGSESANERSRGTFGASGQMVVAGRHGRPSFRIIKTRSGLATSCNCMTWLSDRSSRSSSYVSIAARWFTATSLETRRTNGALSSFAKRCRSTTALGSSFEIMTVSSVASLMLSPSAVERPSSKSRRQRRTATRSANASSEVCAANA